MSVPEPQNDSLVGLTLAGKYRIRAAIAHGAMGRVYCAEQVALEREVALKVLDIAGLSGTERSRALAETFQRRFFLEAASSAKLSHPNTIVIHDHGKADDETYFIAMELLEGRTLREVIEEEAPLDSERVIRIALQICGSLAEAHEHGMVHRDLKPSNVMLMTRGADRDFVKVLDFGLVKLERDERDLTASGALIGTPRYMSPEQVTQREVGPATDIYSLGAVMYHLLTGHPPFDAESKFVLMAAHMNVEPPPLTERCPEARIPAELEGVVLRCLRKEPADRFEGMEDLAEALASCAQGPQAFPGGSSLPSSAAMHSLVESGSYRVPTAEDLEAASGIVPKVKGSSPGRPWALGLFVLAGVLLMSIGLLSGGLLEPAPPAAGGPEAAPEAPPASPEPAPQAAGAPTGPEGAATAGGLGAGAVDPASEASSLQPGGGPEGAAPPASPASPALREVSVLSSPIGAAVRRERIDLGDTPVTLLVPEGQTWTIVLSAPGYRSRSVAVTAGQGEVSVRLRRSASASDAMETMRRTDNRDPWASP